MSTTTLRLPDELRARIAKLAAKSGQTAHSIMLAAIAQKIEEEELRASFSKEADTRFAETMASGTGIPWHDMRAYLKTRASGQDCKGAEGKQVAQVILSAQIQDDFDRIFDFLFEHAPETAVDRIEAIVAALNVLQSSPLIGRPVDNGKRELVIATGASGYLALYRFVPELDMVFVLGVRSQRELGFERNK